MTGRHRARWQSGHVFDTGGSLGSQAVGAVFDRSMCALTAVLDSWQLPWPPWRDPAPLRSFGDVHARPEPPGAPLPLAPGSTADHDRDSLLAGGADAARSTDEVHAA